jgi:hypothetical protein
VTVRRPCQIARTLTAAAIVLWAASSTLLPTKPALAEDKDRGAEPKVPKCVDVRTFSRYGSLGYDHVVEIKNGCDKTVLCLIKTNANPDVTQLEVKAGETGSAVTFRGSPAREFEADVTCERKG